MTCEWTIAHHTYEYCARKRNIPSVLSEMVWAVVVPPPGGFQVYISSSPSVLMSLYHTEDETSIPRTPSSPPTCLRYLDFYTTHPFLPCLRHPVPYPSLASLARGLTLSKMYYYIYGIMKYHSHF